MAHKNAAWSDGAILPRGTGIELLKGGPSGFTRVGNGAAAGQLAIDTSRAFETWGVHFFDANKDGYQDLLMPSFRHGFRAFNGGSDTIGAKKGSIRLPERRARQVVILGSASLGRTLYALDSMSAAGAFYARAVADTGIIVEDTVRHFNAIGSQWGDLNNDGNVDVLLTGTEAETMMACAWGNEHRPSVWQGRWHVHVQVERVELCRRGPADLRQHPCMGHRRLQQRWPAGCVCKH